MLAAVENERTIRLALRQPSLTPVESAGNAESPGPRLVQGSRFGVILLAGRRGCRDPGRVRRERHQTHGLLSVNRSPAGVTNR